MDSKVTSLEQVYTCIEENHNFILQGGAGSGKTESLKRVLEYISSKYPEKKIACITHTNLAVEEIKSRVKSDYTICTIHSFLNDIIKDYKKNIHQVIGEIFKLKKIEDTEHKEYKKSYTKYASSLYITKNESAEKVTGKRAYELDSSNLNKELNQRIEELNNEIDTIIKAKDYDKIKYNETRFDSFKDLTFGHDSLLKISSILFETFPLLSKILHDKFDFVFIDEYQDTHEYIIDIFLNKSTIDSKTIIGLFGDSMQGIYDDGIGDVNEYIKKGLLKKIEKEDNYRCSKQVIDFINKVRNDGLKQELAFKTKDGTEESLNDRQGIVKLYYSIYKGERTASGTPKNKEEYLSKLNILIKEVESKNTEYKKLMLTNKSISKEVGFENLYNIFNDRYTDVKEEIEKDLNRLQLLDLAELSKAFNSKDYNFVIKELKKADFKITTVKDKNKVSEILDKITNSEQGAIEVINLALEYKLIKKSESYSSYINRKDVFLNEIKEDKFYTVFKTHFESDKNTFVRMQKEITELTEESFKENLRLYKKEKFYTDLFSNKIKFQEILNYYAYLNEETDYITMHKTKGTGINNVMIILEEYFWYKYNFKTIFDSKELDLVKKTFNQKLFYVASSRAVNNLICIRMIEEVDELELLSFFDNTQKVII